MGMSVGALESAWADGNYALVDALAVKYKDQVGTIEEKGRLFELLTAARAARGQIAAALRVAREGLSQLGIDVPDPLTPAEVRKVYLRVKLALADRRPESLAAAPPVSDPGVKAALGLMRSTVSAALHADSSLLRLLACRAMSLLLRHGNSADAPYWYALYGMLLCTAADDCETGLKLGRLAQEMADRPQGQPHQAKTIFIVQAFVSHWESPMRATLNALQSGHRAGLQHPVKSQ